MISEDQLDNPGLYPDYHPTYQMDHGLSTLPHLRIHGL